MEKLFLNSQIKAKGDDEVYRAIANTKAIDRDNEIILPSGCENLKSWLKTNPVIFYGHAWMSFDGPSEEQLPIGRAVEAFMKKDGRIQIGWKFSDLDFAQQIRTLVDGEFLNQTSIGFMPKEWVTNVDEIEKLMSENDIAPQEVTRGGETFTRLPYGICTRWELLELSVVSIPSNREADILRSVDSDSAVALAIKSLSSVNSRGRIEEIAKDPEEQEAEATPARRRNTFADNHRSNL